MPRPCDHPDGPPRPETGCKVCLKYATNDKFREYCDRLPAVPRQSPPPVPTPTPPGHGPGTELKELLSTFGLDPGSCNCNRRAILMDQWGVEGCLDRREDILRWLREEWKRLGWLTRMHTGLRALLGGFVGDPRDPAAAVFDEAMRRAAARLPAAPAAPEGEESMRPPLTWAYGVITVPDRRQDLLPDTLRSLARAGFPEPRLFVDGGGWATRAEYQGFNLPVTVRDGPAVGVFLNWYLALLELYGRNPQAERYAIFQDDVLAVHGLREYLDRTTRRPEKAYWNLYTFLNNEPHMAGSRMGTWKEAAILTGRDPANPIPDPERRQCGAGALGLVFTREGVQTLLASKQMAVHPSTTDYPRKNVDGQVVGAMNAAGWREWVHYPSLLYHAGVLSTVEPGKQWATLARSWPGEDWDARTLLAAPAKS